MKKIITSILFSSAIVFSIYNAFSNSNGQGGSTAAPGEQTCSQPACHGSGNGEGSAGGLADNAAGGSVVISGISGTYVPGQLYHLTVRVNQIGCGLFGFNLEALDASSGTAGTLTVTQTGTQLRQGVAGTRAGVSMGHPGSTGSIAGTGTDFFDFTFDWTAPSASVGPITFYAAGMAANNNGIQDSGDQVYYSSTTVTPTTTPAPTILISRTSLTNPAFSALANTVGTVNDLFVAGVSLTGNLSLAVTGTQYKIALANTGPWVTSLSLTAASGTVNGTRVYVQYTGAASGTQTGTLTISGGGATQKTISLSGAVRTPTLSVANPTALNFGTVNVGSGFSNTQTFTYTPANPVDDIILTAPAGYEMSFVQNRDFEQIITLKYSGFAFAPTVYVRLKNPLAAGPINGNVTIATTGATTRTVALTATAVVPAQMVLSSVSTLSLFITNPGTPSPTQSINVSGSGLTDTLYVYGYSTWEVSLNPNSGFGPTAKIVPSSGNVSATPVYVRYAPSADTLEYGFLTVSSLGALDGNVDVNGLCFGNASPTAIKNTNNNTSISVYPNPTASLINIKGLVDKSNIKLYDLSGKLVLQKDAVSNANTENIISINVSNLTNGIYMLVNESGKNKSVHKIVIEK